MELNKLLFPAPRSSYSADLFQGEMVWIPRHISSHPPIPCLYLPTTRGSNKMLLYFHGNAEDLGMSYELLCHLTTALRVHVLGVEYPGYGIYPGNSSESRILEDVEEVYDYLTRVMKMQGSNIFLFGRSIGTGPATWLASKREVGALLLMSGYTCIREVAKSIAGSVLKYFIKDRFRNIDWIQKVKVPVFIVHGQSDTLIPFEQSLLLHHSCKAPCSLLLPESMNHNEFDFFDDLSIPFATFLIQCGVSFELGNNEGVISFPSSLYISPDI